MNEQKNNGKGIFYGVIGVATLIVAIIGATFAYFTASQSAENVITGNAAQITFGLSVTPVVDPGLESGIIPMSNSMVHPAVTAPSTCVDQAGNAVCQIYEITVTNNSSAAIYVDGYVTLTGGSGSPTDDETSPTTMRWAQVFRSGSEDSYTYSTTGASTTAAKQSTATDAQAIADLNNIDAADSGTLTYSHNTANMVMSGGLTTVTTTGYINGNPYEVINKNYIRQSSTNADSKYTHADLTHALVFSQYLTAKETTPTNGASMSKMYIVVWLSETGTNQTPDASATSPVATTGTNFFLGSVYFNSAQGGEVSATFNGYTRVPVSDQG